MKKIAILILFFYCFTISYAPINPEDETSKIEKYFRSVDLSTASLLAALRFNQVVSPEVLLSQAILETGYFKSELCLEHNNLFGMKWPWARENRSSGSTRNGFAIYNCWYDAVIDMKLFQGYYLRRGRDLTDYFSFLKRIGYAQDPKYLKKLKLICSI